MEAPQKQMEAPQKQMEAPQKQNGGFTERCDRNLSLVTITPPKKDKKVFVVTLPYLIDNQQERK